MVLSQSERTYGAVVGAEEKEVSLRVGGAGEERDSRRCDSLMHWSVNRDRSKREGGKCGIQMQKEAKRDSLRSSGCSAIVFIICTTDSEMPKYKRDGK